MNWVLFIIHSVHQFCELNFISLLNFVHQSEHFDGNVRTLGQAQQAPLDEGEGVDEAPVEGPVEDVEGGEPHGSCPQEATAGAHDRLLHQQLGGTAVRHLASFELQVRVGVLKICYKIWKKKKKNENMKKMS